MSETDKWPKRYICRNGVTLPVNVANKIAILRMKGYTHAKIAEMTNLTEAQVVNILNVNHE